MNWLNLKSSQLKNSRISMWFALSLSCIVMLNSVDAARAQTATTTRDAPVGAANLSGQLSGTWVGPFDTLANGESNRIFLKVQQNGPELKGSFLTLGYGMSLYGSIKDGRFSLYRPDRKPVFIQGEISGANLVFTLYGHQVIAHPETEADGGGPPKYIAPPALHRVPSNGLATTPPMGWNSWNKFSSAIDDKSVRAIADALVSSGMRDAGYLYLNIDDTWEGVRDAQGVLQPNRKFPDMKALADYVHSKGLKLGIYSSPGPRTCGGYPGSYGHEELDAKTWASWGVDYLKYDWCRADINDHLDEQTAFKQMEQDLDATGRNIVFSISEYGVQQPWLWGPGVANLWRTTHDIHPLWSSVMQHIAAQVPITQYAKPGAWNDPDMLEIGDGGLTDTEETSHFAMWCMLAAPLFVGTDISALPVGMVSLLTNPELVGIDQDAEGHEAHLVSSSGGIQVWERPLAGGRFAVALFNTTSATQSMSATLAQLGIPAGSYTVRDAIVRVAVSPTSSVVSGSAPSHGIVVYELTPAK
jgi:alpha-galactosidase